MVSDGCSSGLDGSWGVRGDKMGVSYPEEDWWAKVTRRFVFSLGKRGISGGRSGVWVICSTGVYGKDGDISACEGGLRGGCDSGSEKDGR